MECTIVQYIECKRSIADKIFAIDQLIDAMILKTLESVDGATYDSYMMDDGQMKVSTKYRSVQDVTAGITALEKIKMMYLQRLNGRVMSLRTGVGFRGFGDGCY